MNKLFPLSRVLIIAFLFIGISNNFSQNSTILKTLPTDEDCLAPEVLVVYTYENIIVFVFDVETSWYPVWLQYDDGVNFSAVGFGESFTYADKWTPENLQGFEGTYITKVKFFPVEGMADFTLKIWMGEDGDQLIYSQEINEIEYNDWNIIDLDMFVEIIPENGLYVGFEVNSLDDVAGVSNYFGSNNADLVKINGTEWQHLSDYDLYYSWNLGVYVDGDKSVMNSKELLGFNLYRDDELLNDELITNMYYDTLPGTGLYCYNGTAVYSICGESSYGNTSCYDYGGTIGFSELSNSIDFYPNPANDYIRMEGIQNLNYIKIYNSIGISIENIKNPNSTKILISTKNWESGLYFVEIHNEQGIQRSKIIIQH